jgi:hypothetical protein
MVLGLGFHASLEEVVKHKERDDYTLKDILFDPLTYSKSAFGEVFRDLNFEKNFKGNGERKRNLNDVAVLTSFGVSSVPHELIHAGINKLTGGVNTEVMLNDFYGGFILKQFLPGVESKLMFPLIGGYVNPESYGSFAGQLSMALAPYAMTPLGIYLIMKGQEKQSLPLSVLGAGLTIGHVGGILGDFWKIGRDLIYETAELMQITPGGPENENTWFYAGVAVGGFYLGSKIMSLSYRSMKASVKAVRSKFTKKNN